MIGYHGTSAGNLRSIMRDGLRAEPHRGLCFTPDEDIALVYASEPLQIARVQAGATEEEEAVVGLVHADLTGYEGYVCPRDTRLDIHDTYVIPETVIPPERVYVMEVVVRLPVRRGIERLLTRKQRDRSRPTLALARERGVRVLFTRDGFVEIPKPMQWPEAAQVV